MRLTKLKPLFLAATVAAFAGVAAEAPAAVLLVNDGGELTGAEGVDVDGTLYDVTFVDSSCGAIFGSCDALTVFNFATLNDAAAAAQALIDQVFVNGVLGNFDDVPSLTAGCTGVSECNAHVPYVVDGALVRTAVARNNPLGVGSDFVGIGGVGVDIDLSISISTYAVFDAVPVGPDTPGADVPAPGALLLLSFGLAGLGLATGRGRPAA